MRTLVLALTLSVIPAVAADLYTFSVPNGITVGSPAGFATGWGYTIHNESTSLWLVTTSLSAGSFQYATPTLLFTFPDLAPGATVSELFNPTTGGGLYAIEWDSFVPKGYTNSGDFTLSSQWWSGDPSSGGSFVSTAPVKTQAYSASLTPVPEPASLALSIIALIGFGTFRAGSRRRNRLRVSEDPASNVGGYQS